MRPDQTLSSSVDALSTAPGQLLLLVTAIALASVLISGRRRRSRGRIVLVLLCNLLAASSLWLFLWPPQGLGTGGDLVLLTPGFSAEDLSRARLASSSVILQEAQLLSPALSEDPAERQRQLESVEVIAAAGQLRSRLSGGQTLVVHGDGLKQDEWAALDDLSISVALSADDTVVGLQSVRAPQRVLIGEAIPITVHVPATAVSGSLHLVDPFGNEISSLPLVGEAIYRFSTTARSAGNLLYSVVYRSAQEAQLDEATVAVSVIPPQTPSVVLIWSSPSFEARALRDWLSRGNAAVAIRTRISRDRYRDEFINQEPFPLDPERHALPQHVDLLVMDARAWSESGDAARNRLHESVRTSATGLLLIADAPELLASNSDWPALSPALNAPAFLELFRGVDEMPELKHASARLVPQDDVTGRATEYALPDLSSQPMAAARAMGKGRVALTLISDSYRLVTAGYPDQHARYWQTLLDLAGRPLTQWTLIDSASVARLDHRMELCLQYDAASQSANSADQSPKRTIQWTAGRDETGEGINLTAEPHAIWPNRYCAYHWPTESGWHRISSQGQTAAVYVHPTTAHAGESRQARRMASQLFQQSRAGHLTGSSFDQTVSTGSAGRPMSRLWFFLLFTLFCTLCWLEQKRLP